MSASDVESATDACDAGATGLGQPGSTDTSLAMKSNDPEVLDVLFG